MKIIILIWTLLCIYGAFFGQARVDLSLVLKNPDPNLESSLGIGLWIVIWFIVAMLLHVFENILHSSQEEREKHEDPE